jgi:hypothetical protein
VSGKIAFRNSLMQEQGGTIAQLKAAAAKQEALNAEQQTCSANPPNSP